MPSILLVDDNQPIRVRVKELLEDQDDWTCTEAEDGEEAVEECDKRLPDVILMDMQMPKLNGLQASQSILKKHPKARIAMLTIYPTSELARQAKKYGLKGFCVKTDLNCVVEVVEALLEGREYFQHVN
jgi:two-component system, NarL family, response regulator DegU